MCAYQRFPVFSDTFFLSLPVDSLDALCSAIACVELRLRLCGACLVLVTSLFRLLSNSSDGPFILVLD
jgi:hypothetical protein